MQRIKTLLSMAFVSILISSCSSENNLAGQNILLNQQTVAQQSQDVSAESYNNPAQTTINSVFHGTVTKLLPDDTSGLKHEKFMFQITDGLSGKYNGQVVTVAHDTSMAPYVPVKVGSKLEIKGDFLPDATPTKVLHWTHKSDNPNHASGYIILDGKTYQ